MSHDVYGAGLRGAAEMGRQAAASVANVKISTSDIDWEATSQLLANQQVGKLEFHSCNCIGPRNGEPLCRCRMRNVKIVDGRYVEVLDHGPAQSWKQAEQAFPG